MDSTVFNPLSSPHWHRVASLRPRLVPGVMIARQWSRGQRWHVLRPGPGAPACRLNPAAYAIAARLDGRRTVSELWSRLDQHAQAPSQDDVVAVLRQLQQHGLIGFDRAPDFGALAPATALPTPTTEATADLPEAGRRFTGLSWRMPLGDPSTWLRRGDALGRALYSRAGWALWLAVMAWFVVNLVVQAEALKAHAAAWMHTRGHLLLALAAYPVIKALHEAAHGLAVHRWGGQVREWGVNWLLFMPVPYVDASDAAGFRDRAQRLLVSAAGIMAELFLAALGLALWRWQPEGLWHDLGFVVWFIGGVSTLLFNANPLQRLDGYHVLTDALDLPNLGPRSRQWWRRAVQRWLHPALPPDEVEQAPPAPGERPWLIAYAPLAYAYQLLLWTTLVWWLGGISGRLGAAGALVAVALGVLRPAWQWTALAWQAVLWQDGTSRTRAAWRAAVLGLPALLLVLPWPDSAVVRGVVWAPDRALVRAEVDGFVEQVSRPHGSAVKAGDLLLTLRNPALLARREQVQARLAQAEQDQFQYMDGDAARAGQGVEETQRLQAELAHVEQRIAALEVRARAAGRVVLPPARDLPGRFVKRGELLGHVLTGQAPTIRLAADESQALRLQGARGVEVMPAGPLAEVWPGRLVRDTGSAVRQLPTAALSEEHGGPVATDPQDKKHLATRRPVVLMDVQLDRAPGAERLGERAWVRFDLGWSPPLVQGWRWLEARLHERFNPSR